MTWQPLTAGQRRLAESQIHMARGVAWNTTRTWPRHRDRSDLIAGALLGLVEAARRYDPSRGVPFSRFAYRRVRGAVVDVIRSDHLVPRSVHEKFTTDDEWHWAQVLSLDVAADSERMREGDVATQTLGDAIPDSVDITDAYDRAQLVAYMSDAIRLLPDRHRQVVVARFFDGRTAADIATDFGVTGARISQLITAALVLLRHGIAAQYDHLTPPPPPANTGSGVGVARLRASYAAAIAQAHRKTAA